MYAAATRRGSNAEMHSVSRAGKAHVAQSVEHVLGKDEVTGSIPVVGSSKHHGDGTETLPF